MSVRTFVLRIAAAATIYIVVFALIVIVMSSMTTGNPRIDSWNNSLALSNLIGKFLLSAAVGTSVGYLFNHGAWLGAVVMIAILIAATVLPSSYFMLAFFKNDDIVFYVAYVIVAAAGAKVGNFVALRRHGKKTED